MKKVLLSLLFIAAAFAGYSQSGLDSIIVEKYYVSDANDESGSSGILPAGSVTYRIYVDMAEGHKLLNIYGSVNETKNHPLFLKTTTSFFNNTDYGSSSPAFSSTNTKKNTVMLDSWITNGAACNGFWGVMKSEDDGLNNFVNKDDLLMNNDASAGFPLSEQDGMFAGTPPSTSTIGAVNTDVLNDGTTDGNSFIIDDGAWFVLGGVVGPTVHNRVLIAQLTTDGELSYELNLVIKSPDVGEEYGISANYVAKNPINIGGIGAPEFSDPKYKLSSSNYVGVSDLTNNKFNINVYPNPTTEGVYVNLNTNKISKINGYKIMNITGQVVVETTLNVVTNKYDEYIPISTLVSGVYTIVLFVDGKPLMKKIIKN